MATTEDVARLILQAESKGFDDAKTKIAGLENELATLTVGYRTGAVSEEEFFKSGQRIIGQLDQLKGGYETAEKALKKYGDTSSAIAGLTAQATSKMAGLGQVGLQTGRIVQDFAQGGIGGILNNIEGLTMALGMGSGLAGILTIVGVAFLLLKPHMQGFIDSMWGVDEATKTVKGSIGLLEDRIKELQAKTLKLDVDQRELDAAIEKVKTLKEFKTFFEGLSKEKTTSAKESGEAVHETLRESDQGLPGLKGDMQQQIFDELMEKEKQKHEAQQQVAMKEHRDLIEEANRHPALSPDYWVAFHGAAMAAKRAKEPFNVSAGRRHELAESAGIEVGRITKGAFEGDQGTQEELAGLLGRTGHEDLAHGVRSNSIASREEYDRQEAETEGIIERMKDRRLDAKAQAQRDKTKTQEGLASMQAEVDAKNKRDAERKQAINENVSTIGGAMLHREGPGSLTDATLGGLAKGEDETQLRARLLPQITAQATEAGAPKDIIGEVSKEILDRAVEHAKATAAASGKGIQAGAGEALRDRAIHFDRSQDNEGDRRKKDQEETLQRQFAGQIQNLSGGSFSPEQAMEGGKAALEMVQHGADVNTAVAQAMMEQMNAMAEMRQQMMQQRAQFMALANGFQQLHGAMEPPNNGLLNWGRR